MGQLESPRRDLRQLGQQVFLMPAALSRTHENRVMPHLRGFNWQQTVTSVLSFQGLPLQYSQRKAFVPGAF